MRANCTNSRLPQYCLQETDRAARTALARLVKRDGDFVRARELWEGTLGDSREGYEAYEQLAIYFEHEAREPRQALAIAREALAQLRRANQVGTIAAATYRKTKARFEHRLIAPRTQGWPVAARHV